MTIAAQSSQAGTNGAPDRARHRVIRDGIAAQLPDIDPEETEEWLDSFDAMVDAAGQQRARYLMLRLLGRAKETSHRPALVDHHRLHQHHRDRRRASFPGRRGLGAHLSSVDPLERGDSWCTAHNGPESVSAATSRPTPVRPACTRSATTISSAARVTRAGGDHVFFQGPRPRPACTPGRSSKGASPRPTSTAPPGGLPPRGGGIPSYPHPRLMPQFWEHPTVSMGLGPMNAIQQARFDRYLHNRGLKDTSDQHTWAFLGDGELDEVESRGLIHVAALDGLDNLTFVINCNLQRLDGPVRGNGKIIQELRRSSAAPAGT